MLARSISNELAQMPSLRRVHLKFISRAVSLIVRTEIVMKRTLVAALVASSLSAPVVAMAAEGDQQASRAERVQQWAADRETVLDAKLTGMKAGLGLTADQEKLWGPFESA